jgi:carboxylesterase type B
LIATNTAYRIDPFAFLYGDDIARAGVTNLGLKDQSLAMHSIQGTLLGFEGMHD